MRNAELMTKVLPDDTEKALYAMIGCTEKAIDAFEQETNALALGEDLALAQHSDTKKVAHQLYQAAACEFMARRDEFIEYGGQLIDKLKTLQIELKNRAQVNMGYWEPMLPKNNKVLQKKAAPANKHKK